jgi:hypothetical protein
MKCPLANVDASESLRAAGGAQVQLIMDNCPDNPCLSADLTSALP